MRLITMVSTIDSLPESAPGMVDSVYYTKLEYSCTKFLASFTTGNVPRK